MLDDLCDLSPYEKGLTFYFTICTIMFNIILQRLGLLVALMNFIRFFYQVRLYMTFFDLCQRSWPFANISSSQKVLQLACPITMQSVHTLRDPSANSPYYIWFILFHCYFCHTLHQRGSDGLLIKLTCLWHVPNVKCLSVRLT
jgi:hypothetical protein